MNERKDEWDSPDSLQTRRFSPRRETETWRLSADELEPRIETLGRIVTGLSEEIAYLGISDAEYHGEPVRDLRVKVEALRWMFRIAMHLNGTAREMVMVTVSNSVGDLEIALAAQLHGSAEIAAA